MLIDTKKVYPQHRRRNAAIAGVGEEHLEGGNQLEEQPRPRVDDVPIGYLHVARPRVEGGMQRAHHALPCSCTVSRAESHGLYHAVAHVVTRQATQPLAADFLDKVLQIFKRHTKDVFAVTLAGCHWHIQPVDGDRGAAAHLKAAPPGKVPVQALRAKDVVGSAVWFTLTFG